MAWLWQLDELACTGCGICKDVCPEAAIDMTRDMPLPVPVPEACTGCEGCVAECPFAAIIVAQNPPANSSWTPAG